MTPAPFPTVSQTSSKATVRRFDRPRCRPLRIFLTARTTLAAVAASTAVAVLVFAAPASALTVHVFSASFGSAGSGDGQVSSPQGVAVNETSGNVYVADSGNARVDEFSAAGAFVRAFGADVGGPGINTCTTGCVAGTPGSGPGAFTTPTFIAIDNSGGSSEGDVYVGDTNNNVVTKFDASGNLIASWGSAGQLDGSAATTPIAGPFGPLAGVTVDASGNLWVYDTNGDMFEFRQDGSFTTDWNSGRGVIPGGIEADSAGNLYVLTGAGTVEQFTNTGTDVGPVNGDVSNPTGFALDRSVNEVYMDNGGSQIYHYAASCDAGGSCTALDSFGSGDLTAAAGLAVNPTNTNVYAADTGDQRIDLFTAITLPDVATNPAAAITQTTATLNGYIDPAGGGAVTDCHFEYTDDATFQAQGYTGATSVPCNPTAPISSATDVSASITGLTAGTLYHFRLDATNDGVHYSETADQTFATAAAGFGIKSFSVKVLDQNGQPYTQAGGHPYALETDIGFNTIVQNGTTDPDEQVRDITVSLPPGLIGNPTAVPTCTDAQLVNRSCPIASQIGVVHLDFVGQNPGFFPNLVPVYNLERPSNLPAQFGFYHPPVSASIDTRVRTGSDYGLDSQLTTIPEPLLITGSKLVLWGNPADPSHNAQRYCGISAGDTFGCSSPSPAVAFLTNPTSCVGPQTVTASADSWQHQGQFVTSTDTLPATTGCGALQFNPSIWLQPDTTIADSPSGLSVDLKVPVGGLEDPNGLSSANLKKAVVTLPVGVSVNPSAAAGLAACSPDQIGLDNANDPTCPDAAKVGTAEIDTPLLPDPLTGSLYLAQQFNNPFHSLLAGYLVASGDGVLIKLAGRFDTDPNTGQITATFDNNPQQPFTELKLTFFGGPHGVLATPESCGTFTTTSVFTPWSFPDSGAAATSNDSFEIDSGCVTGFAPSLTAGTQNAQAGAYSPFVLSLSRSDTDQNFSGLSVKLPPGMLAKLAGVQECSDQQLASISSQPGTGASELANPSCPAGSQVGTVTVGAGTGPDPYFLSGQAYLTGPYDGAPYGLAVVVPAVAGPLDLGTVVVRQGLYVDPTTAQVTDVSDPFPTILDGIPLDIRRIDVDLNRSGFTVNPTSCDSMSVTGTLTSTGGLSAPLSSAFQVGGCSSLGFSPKLKIGLSGRGKTRSGDHPTLTATLTDPSGQANIKTAKVALPLSLALDPNNSQHVCNYQVAQAVHGGGVGCPTSTIVGQATAVTPLLDQPLTGPVYLVQGIRFGAQGQPIHTLPSLLVPLRGQIALDLRAQSSVSGGKLVTTFSTIPDAPVSKFTLKINGGPKGILVITGRGRTICGKAQVSNAHFGAQSGKAEALNPRLSTPACKAVKKATKKAKSRAKKG